MTVSAFAPAKINLYLHVVGRRADGYHLLDSLVAFADIGDRVTAAPARRLSLTIGGPEAAPSPRWATTIWCCAPRGSSPRERSASAGAAPFGAALRLDKQLPVASGIGGGSSDAAATLRALDRLWRRPLDRDALAALALTLGADTPACLAARPVWVGGIGERIEPMPPGLPPAGIVLANPRRALPTAACLCGPARRLRGRRPLRPDAAGRRRARRGAWQSAATI